MIDILKEMSEDDLNLLIKSTHLRKKYEEILIMKYVKNLSHYEIAKLKNKEVQTIANEVCIARKKFYQKIK